MKDFGLLEGAVGSTISHDSHNLILVYKNPEDAFLILKTLEESGGGMALASRGKVNGLVPLPCAGLMSDQPAETVNAQLLQYRDAYYRQVREDRNLQSVSLMSLTALPGVIITDLGLADGITQTFLPVFEAE